MKTALLLVDLQRDFLRADGRLPVAAHQVGPLLAAAEALAEQARERGWPIAWVVNAFPRWSVANPFRRFAAIAGSEGAALDERAPRPLSGEPTFEKRTGDGFARPELAEWLRERGVERVALAGVYAGGCVRATARGAARAGFRVTVVADGLADRGDRARTRALSAMARAGVEVVAAAEALS